MSWFSFFRRRKTLPDLPRVVEYVANTEHMRAAGLRFGDNLVKLQFVLPLPAGEAATQQALGYAALHGLESATVVDMIALGPGYSSFMLQGRSVHQLGAEAWAAIDTHNEALSPTLNFNTLQQLVQSKIKKKIDVVVFGIGAQASTLSFASYPFSDDRNSLWNLLHSPLFRSHLVDHNTAPELLAERLSSLRAEVLLCVQEINDAQRYLLELQRFEQRLSQAAWRKKVLLISLDRLNEDAAVKARGFDKCLPQAQSGLRNAEAIIQAYLKKF